jgi:hypothetical protein
VTQPRHPKDYAGLGLTSNPFIPIPPIETYEIGFRALFSARAAEVEQVYRYATGARAVFIVAPYGGGKTMVLLEALSRLKESNAAVTYASFDRLKGFRVSLIEGMVSAGMVEAAGESDILKQTRMVIRRLHKDGRRVVLAVDDLDRATDISEVFQVTHDVRDFLGDGAAVIVTGQPFGVTFDLHTSAGGVFQEVDIPEFSCSAFHEMLGKYLKSVHLEPHLPLMHPFDEQAAQFICREMSDAKTTPRLFNFAVCRLIEMAAARHEENIPINLLLEVWPFVAERVVRGLTPLQRRHLDVIFQEGEVSEDTQRAIVRLGDGELAEYPEVRDSVLRPLVESNLVYVRNEKGKDYYRLTPHTASTIADIVGKPLPPEVRARLTAQWGKCAAEGDPHRKRQALEDFLVEFMSTIPGFRVPHDGLDLRTEFEELDVVVEILGHEHHIPYGTLTICECKNWKVRVPGDALSHFRDKLKARGCRFGVFIAVNGVLPGFREKMKAYLSEGIVIALLSGEDFGRLEMGDAPAAILRDAYYATLKYKGEAASS